MLSSGLCDAVEPAWGQLVSARAQQLAERLPYGPEGQGDLKALWNVSRDFASLLYSTLVQQMQKPLQEDEEEDESLKETVRDFVGMFLPGVVAESPQDPLSAYIYEHLSARCGGALDERA